MRIGGQGLRYLPSSATTARGYGSPRSRGRQLLIWRPAGHNLAGGLATREHPMIILNGLRNPAPSWVQGSRLNSFRYGAQTFVDIPTPLPARWPGRAVR